MYLWRKFASSEWLTLYEAILQEWTNSTLAVIEHPNRKRLQLEVPCASRRTALRLVKEFGGALSELPRNWRHHFAATARAKPIRIGNRLIVVGSKRSRSKSEQIKHRLVVPASGAFGTGEHATTAMCLRLLERVSRPWPDGWSMLDAGTGSGILALAARCLGAHDVMATDTDPGAITIAESNARLNRIRGIQFKEADVTKLTARRKFDVIAANLFSELLIAAIPAWNAHFLILSGLLRSQEREVVRALHRNRFSMEESRRRGKWVAILACRQKAG